MIKDGFMYIAALVFIAAVLIYLPKLFKGKKAETFFKFAPPIVLIYLGLMLLCTVKLWDLDATAGAYGALKNPLLYAMLFIMLLRCDLRKIIKLGPKMLIGFFSATISIALGFVIAYAIMHRALGEGLLVSAICQKLGGMIAVHLSFFDKATWTVLIVTVLGVLLALTPFGKLKGTEEISNVLLYIVIALIASRADLTAMGNAPAWLLTGLIVLVIHVAIMLVLAKVIKLDIFTCAVASLANIGGTATAPVLAGTYSSALVPVGIIMALLGYVIGTGGGLIVAKLMSFFG